LEEVMLVAHDRREVRSFDEKQMEAGHGTSPEPTRRRNCFRLGASCPSPRSTEIRSRESCWSFPRTLTLRNFAEANGS
jgi:hypothetical protein